MWIKMPVGLDVSITSLWLVSDLKQIKQSANRPGGQIELQSEIKLTSDLDGFSQAISKKQNWKQIMSLM